MLVFGNYIASSIWWDSIQPLGINNVGSRTIESLISIDRQKIKTKKNIFDKICELENLRLAHHNARKDKSFYKEVKMVNANEDFYLKEIQKLLISWEYKITSKDYKLQKIHDKGKDRILMKLDYYPHRIVQRAIMQQIEDVFMRVFSPFSCASVPWRWGKLAMKLMNKYMRDVEGTKYCLKLDVRKFYPNINHEILKKLIRKKIWCKKTLELLDMIIDSHPTDKWLPIWSYLSQYLANYYLTFFDHRLKEILKVKYVVRYMDDIVILSWSKAELREIFEKIKQYLLEELELTIKQNYQIFPTKVRWIDFVWYRHFPKYRLLRKKTCKRMKKKMVKIFHKQKNWNFINFQERCSTNSYIWWLIHCDSYRLYDKYLRPLIWSAIKYYYFVIAKKDKKKVRKYKKKLLIKKWNVGRFLH